MRAVKAKPSSASGWRAATCASRWCWAIGPGLKGLKGLWPGYIRAEVEASLRRPQTDHIDLHQSHGDDTETPLAETQGAFVELMRAGKLRAWLRRATARRGWRRRCAPVPEPGRWCG